MQQALSGLTLTGHHQLWSEVAGLSLVGCSTFCSNHGLAIDNALAKCLFVSFDSTHCRSFRGALSAAIYIINGHKVVLTRGRRLLRVVECFVLVEDFVLGDKDAVDGRRGCRGGPV